MGKINLNSAELEHQIGILQGHINDFSSTADGYTLKNCTGKAIEYIDLSFKEMDLLASSFHDLMAATNNYLNKVKYNINLCEADNTYRGDN